MHKLQDTDLMDYLDDAKGIAWDTCHKIYVLMDDNQMQQMKEYDYNPLISAEKMSTKELFDTITGWYDDSCGLKFIQAVTTLPNDGEEYHDIVGQFDDEEDEEEIQDDEDDDDD